MNKTLPGNFIFLAPNWRQSDKFQLPKRENNNNNIVT